MYTYRVPMSLCVMLPCVSKVYLTVHVWLFCDCIALCLRLSHACDVRLSACRHSAYLTVMCAWTVLPCVMWQHLGSGYTRECNWGAYNTGQSFDVWKMVWRWDWVSCDRWSLCRGVWPLVIYGSFPHRLEHLAFTVMYTMAFTVMYTMEANGQCNVK